jgi:hypothetical protein
MRSLEKPFAGFHLESAIAFSRYPDASLNLILNLQEDGAMLYV